MWQSKYGLGLYVPSLSDWGSAILNNFQVALSTERFLELWTDYSQVCPEVWEYKPAGFLTMYFSHGEMSPGTIEGRFETNTSVHWRLGCKDLAMESAIGSTLVLCRCGKASLGGRQVQKES